MSDGATVLQILAWLTAALAGLGLGSVLAGAAAVHRFAGRPHPSVPACPPISVLKPLCGHEPQLDAALATICRQSYPGEVQIIFGVQDPADPALLAVQRLQARFPDHDIAVATGAQTLGPNRKVCNLINMLPLARHDVLVFSDSDLHVAPDYLYRLVAALRVPGTGLVTTLCRGLPTVPRWAARLGATHISHCFLPGVLLSRLLGRQDCLGTTMALRRSTLAAVGGLHALVAHVADDNVLSQRMRALGLRVDLADTVPATSMPDATLGALWQHELRWARTIRILQPGCFAASVLQFPLFWAAAAVGLTAGAGWSAGLFATAWVVRAAAAQFIDHRLRRAYGPVPVWPVPVWLLPLRDLLSVAEVCASYLSARVVWRGHVMDASLGRATKRERPAFPAGGPERAGSVFSRDPAVTIVPATSGE